MNRFRDVTKGPGDLPGDDTNPNSPNYDNEAQERADEAAEREEEEREEYIAATIKPVVAERMRDEEYTVEPFGFLSHDQEVDALTAAGRFVAVFERAETNEEMAEAGFVLWKLLRHYAVDFITEIAKQDAAEKYEAEQRIPWHQKRSAA